MTTRTTTITRTPIKGIIRRALLGSLVAAARYDQVELAPVGDRLGGGERRVFEITVERHRQDLDRLVPRAQRLERLPTYGFDHRVACD